jgi:hypothetical protein
MRSPNIVCPDRNAVKAVRGSYSLRSSEFLIRKDRGRYSPLID